MSHQRMIMQHPKKRRLSTLDRLGQYAADREHPEPELRLAGLLADAAIRRPGPTMGQQHLAVEGMRAAVDELVAERPYLLAGLNRLLDELEFAAHPGEIYLVEETADTGVGPIDSEPIRAVLLLVDQHVETDEAEEDAA